MAIKDDTIFGLFNAKMAERKETEFSPLNSKMAVKDGTVFGLFNSKIAVEHFDKLHGEIAWKLRLENSFFNLKSKKAILEAEALRRKIHQKISPTYIQWRRQHFYKFQPKPPIISSKPYFRRNLYDPLIHITPRSIVFERPCVRKLKHSSEIILIKKDKVPSFVGQVESEKKAYKLKYNLLCDSGAILEKNDYESLRDKQKNFWELAYEDQKTTCQEFDEEVNESLRGTVVLTSTVLTSPLLQTWKWIESMKSFVAEQDNTDNPYLCMDIDEKH